jgi:xanthine dehydrogenase molybdenum-binding subunit
MRAYGVPQIAFPSECNLDDIAVTHGWDPLEFRLQNMQNLDHVNPQSFIQYDIRGLKEAMLKGKELIGWDKKRKAYANQTGTKRSGVGMACFTFESGTWPYRVEIGGADISLNQDGSLFVRVGATDIGQGSDTVFSQMVAESTGITYDKVRVDPITDTDINPFDTGAYSTRQSFVSGQAVKKAAEEIKGKILARAEKMLSIGREVLDVENDYVVRDLTREKLLSVADLAMHSYYDTQGAQVITSSVSNSVHFNAVTMGVGFADITVDIATGKVEINQIINVHDCGTVLNPVTAAGQVHGGMSMGLGYALSENMMFDEKTGRPLNNNLLDYKIPTLLDTPELTAAFVEIHNENGPYGNKGLGEPPTIPVAPAIRNAILHATGVGVNKLPMNPQTLFEHFREAGLV